MNHWYYGQLRAQEREKAAKASGRKARLLASLDEPARPGVWARALGWLRARRPPKDTSPTVVSPDVSHRPM